MLKEVYKINISDVFTNMLEEIVLYYSNYSIKYSNSIRVEVYKAISILQVYPYIFPLISKSNLFRKVVIKNRFTIICSIENNKVNLIYFLDSRRNNSSYMVEEEIEQYQV